MIDATIDLIIFISSLYGCEDGLINIGLALHKITEARPRGDP
jgi:hypothetical protein